MHCEWKALDEIADPRIATKLKKFLAKNGTDPLPPPSADDDDGTTVLFNPDYVEVDRVLDIRIYDRASGDIVTDDVLNPDGTVKRPQSQQRNRKKRGRPPRSRTREEGLDDEAATTNVDTPDTAESETQDEAPTLDDEQPVTVTYYLVKWRSLPYEDATWELAEDVDPAKVREFMRIRNPPKNPPVIRDSNHKVCEVSFTRLKLKIHVFTRRFLWSRLFDRTPPCGVQSPRMRCTATTTVYANTK